jgi:predicted hydrocarbon binding protein
MLRAGSREKLEGGQVKGSMLRSRFEWLKDAHPEVERDEVIASLPVASVERLKRGILSSSWYPFEDLVALDKNLWERYHREMPDILQEFGRHSAKKNLTVISVMTPHEFFRNSVKLHDRFQDFGKAEYEQTGETSGKMVYLGYPCYSPVFCESALGFFEQCLILFGAKSPKVTETQCHCRGDASCTYSMSWK